MQQALMYLAENCDSTIKGRMVYNGNPTLKWLRKEDSASPTVTLEGLIVVMCIDTKECHDIMSSNVPNAFIQTKLPTSSERIIMKISGMLVDLLVDESPTKYAKYVVYENGVKVLYVKIFRESNRICQIRSI